MPLSRDTSVDPLSDYDSLLTKAGARGGAPRTSSSAATWRLPTMRASFAAVNAGQPHLAAAADRRLRPRRKPAQSSGVI